MGNATRKIDKLRDKTLCSLVSVFVWGPLGAKALVPSIPHLLVFAVMSSGILITALMASEAANGRHFLWFLKPEYSMEKGAGEEMRNGREART